MIRPAQINRPSVTFVAPEFQFAFLKVDYNGSLKNLIVRDGLDVCGGNVFQSLIIVLGMNEYAPGSDWERPHMVKNMAHSLKRNFKGLCCHDQSRPVAVHVY